MRGKTRHVSFFSPKRPLSQRGDPPDRGWAHRPLHDSYLPGAHWALWALCGGSSTLFFQGQKTRRRIRPWSSELYIRSTVGQTSPFMPGTTYVGRRRGQSALSNGRPAWHASRRSGHDMSRIATVACHFSRAHRVSFCYLDIRTLCRCFRGDDDRRAQPVRGQDLCHVVGLGHVRGVVWEFCGRGGLSLVDIILV